MEDYPKALLKTVAVTSKRNRWGTLVAMTTPAVRDQQCTTPVPLPQCIVQSENSQLQQPSAIITVGGKRFTQAKTAHVETRSPPRCIVDFSNKNLQSGDKSPEKFVDFSDTGSCQCSPKDLPQQDDQNYYHHSRLSNSNASLSPQGCS